MYSAQLFIKGAAVSAFLIASVAVDAMDMEYSPAGGSLPASILVRGEVLLDDYIQLEKLLDLHPDVTRIVVENSPGGAMYGGIHLARIIYQRGLEVDLQGSMASAATTISLGARNKLIYFEGGAAGAIATDLRFHCAYIKAADGCHAQATKASARVLQELTGRPWEEWFDTLMATSPETVVSISLQEIMSYDNWECEYEYGYQTCTRHDDPMFNYRRSPMRRYFELSELFSENYDVWLHMPGREGKRAVFYPHITRRSLTKEGSCNPTISGHFSYLDGSYDDFNVALDFSANGTRSDHWEDLLESGVLTSDVWFYSARRGAKPLVELKVTPSRDPMVGEVHVTRMVFYSSHDAGADMFIPLPGADASALQQALLNLRDACY